MNSNDKFRELEILRAKVHQLELEIEQESKKAQWVPSGYYTTYHILAGMMLGFVGAISSLIFNVVGSLLTQQHPLQLIRVYMTFPLGERALQIESGAVLALGCCLYLMTGTAYGVFFHIILSRFFSRSKTGLRFTVSTTLGLLLWVINFYGILSWLQPAAFGGSWIVEMIPVWVAVLTHLVFAWTLLALDEWGYFDREGHLNQKI